MRFDAPEVGGVRYSRAQPLKAGVDEVSVQVPPGTAGSPMQSLPSWASVSR